MRNQRLCPWWGLSRVDVDVSPLTHSRAEISTRLGTSRFQPLTVELGFPQRQAALIRLWPVGGKLAKRNKYVNTASRVTTVALDPIRFLSAARLKQDWNRHVRSWKRIYAGRTLRWRGAISRNANPFIAVRQSIDSDPPSTNKMRVVIRCWSPRHVHWPKTQRSKLHRPGQHDTSVSNQWPAADESHRPALCQ
jgi:hypothetical protein